MKINKASQDGDIDQRSETDDDVNIDQRYQGAIHQLIYLTL